MADSQLGRAAAVSFDKLPKRDRELLQKARAMVQREYAPYSRFGVGANGQMLRANGGII